jgi:GTP cyclohydrolase I
MVNKTKTDSGLGLEVHKHLQKNGVETPILDKETDTEAQIQSIKEHFIGIMKVLKLDLGDDSLKESPTRVAKMYVNEIFYGLDYTNFPKCTVIENKMGYDEMVIEKDITCISNCEHHFVNIDGVCHVGYIPEEKVVGLSKLNRVVDFFSKRPQVQERLTEQIYHSLQYILGTDNIAVVIKATHNCVKSRGIRDTLSSTITSKMGGCFKKEGDSSRKEFLSLVKE